MWNECLFNDNLTYKLLKIMNKKIATNIITGFLGVGKTTSILQLLKQKKIKINGLY